MALIPKGALAKARHPWAACRDPVGVQLPIPHRKFNSGHEPEDLRRRAPHAASVVTNILDSAAKGRRGRGSREGKQSLPPLHLGPSAANRTSVCLNGQVILECGCATLKGWNCRFRASRGGRGLTGWQKSSSSHIRITRGMREPISTSKAVAHSISLRDRSP